VLVGIVDQLLKLLVAPSASAALSPLAHCEQGEQTRRKQGACKQAQQQGASGRLPLIASRAASAPAPKLRPPSRVIDRDDSDGQARRRSEAVGSVVLPLQQRSVP
jgi:hypothetical protein